MTSAEDLQALIESATRAPYEVFDTRRPILRLCGDCGPSWTTNDECQWCGGFSVPLTNQILTKGGDRGRKEEGEADDADAEET